MTDEQLPADRDEGEHVGVVSVMIPLYNHEATIERALDSVLLSTNEKIELIISDDGSVDRSAEIAASWIDRHRHRFAAVKMVRQPSNLGITGNLNFLIASSRGQYVTALGSDDELTDGAIDAQRTFLESHPEKDFVFANVVSIDDEGRIGGAYFAESSAAILQHPICSVFDAVFSWSMPWGRLFARRSALLEFGPYISTHSFEDRWSGLKIVQTRRFGYLPRVMYRYRVRPHGTGTAGLGAERLFRDWWDVESRLVNETTGLLRWLLWIRVHSANRGQKRSTSRMFWAALRRGLDWLHRFAARARHFFFRFRSRTVA